MKGLFYLMVGVLNQTILWFDSSLKISKSKFYFCKFKIQKSNKGDFNESQLKKVMLEIVGSNNKISGLGCSIEEATISITGSGNEIILEQGVVLRKSNIIIRGTKCLLLIGKGTTFGSVRIVNVGMNNTIQIGGDCLFADNIEIWASDTHSIFDENGLFCNPEQPVIIKDKVWVGSHVKILKGVTINTGAVIGMGCMVTKDIEEKSLNVGSPARKIKDNITWALDYKIN